MKDVKKLPHHDESCDNPTLMKTIMNVINKFNNAGKPRYIDVSDSNDIRVLCDIMCRVIDAYEHDKQLKSKIRIKYVDNELGEAAKELGLPFYVYEGDAGMDLPIVLPKADREHGLTIFPGDRTMLHTGMIIEFPVGYWGRIIHRSSTERRYRLRVIEGVIDDYRGEVICQVHNMNSFPIVVEHGQSIGQLILTKVASFEVEEATELRPSARGANGFGSSGKKKVKRG